MRHYQATAKLRPEDKRLIRAVAARVRRMNRKLGVQLWGLAQSLAWAGRGGTGFASVFVWRR